MFDLHVRAPPLLGHFEAEPASHLSTRWNPSERKAGDVEWEIEADDRRSQRLTAPEEDVFDERCVRHA